MKKLIAAIKAFIQEEKLFKIPEFCLTINGFAGRSKLHKTIQGFLISCVAYAAFSQLCFAVMHRKDLIEASDAFATFVTGIFVEVKALSFLFKRDKFDGLKEKIGKLNNEGL
jgi:hypothetical protein